MKDEQIKYGRPQKYASGKARKISITLPPDLVEKLENIRKYDYDVETISQVIYEVLAKGKKLEDYQDKPLR